MTTEKNVKFEKFLDKDQKRYDREESARRRDEKKREKGTKVKR